MDRAWAEARTDEKHSPEEIKDQLNNYRQVEQAISPYLKELSQLWQGIIFGSRREVIRKKDGPFQHGADLNVVEAIRQWPEIASGQHDMARVMDKMVREEVLVKTPELIRLRIVADLSGSMTKDRRKVLKETVVLLLSSLREFNAQLNMNRAHTKTKLTVDTELWGFGSEAKVLKPFKDELKGRDDQLAIIQAVEGLDFEGGSTSDHHALEGILESLTDQEKRDIDLKKTMEIVFEITDGGSDLPVRAKAAVDTLSEKGIIIRSFQVGTVSKDETEKFNSVWNINRAQPFGEAIGREIENLIPAVKDALRKYLGNIRL